MAAAAAAEVPALFAEGTMIGVEVIEITISVEMAGTVVIIAMGGMRVNLGDAGMGVQSRQGVQLGKEVRSEGPGLSSGTGKEKGSNDWHGMGSTDSVF